MSTRKVQAPASGEESPALALAEPPAGIIFRARKVVAGPGGLIIFEPNVTYRDPAMIHHAMVNDLPFDTIEE